MKTPKQVIKASVPPTKATKIAKPVSNKPINVISKAPKGPKNWIGAGKRNPLIDGPNG